MFFEDPMEEELATPAPQLPSWLTADASEHTPRHKRETLAMGDMSETEFCGHFRMSKDAFHLLLRKLVALPLALSLFPDVPEITREQRLMAVIWYLATTDSYRSIGANFGLATSSVFESVTNISNLIIQLEREYIRFPTEEEQDAEIATMETNYGFPGVIGCIDGTHIEIFTPKDDAEAYFNRKSRYSLNVELCCNSQLEIIHFVVGCPGSYHDGRVFRISNLANLLSQLPPDRHVLGDSAYPLSHSLITPYKDTGRMTQQESSFNKSHSSARQVIENTNALLKQKFRRLKFCYVFTPTRAELIVRTCIILHNFLIRQDCIVARYPPTCATHVPHLETAKEKRDWLARYMLTRG